MIKRSISTLSSVVPKTSPLIKPILDRMKRVMNSAKITPASKRRMNCSEVRKNPMIPNSKNALSKYLKVSEHFSCVEKDDLNVCV